MKIRSTATRYIADARSLGGGEKKFPRTPEGKRQAKAHLARVQAEHDQRGVYTNPIMTPTYEQAAADYLVYEQERARRGELSAAHVDNKRVALARIGELKYEGRALNSVRLGDLRPGAIKREVLPALFADCAYATAQKKAVILKHMMTWAVETAEILTFNPAAVSLPKRPAAEDRAADRISKAAVISIIKAADERYSLAIKFAALTGLRAGEQLALTWDDVDFDAGVVRVNKAMKKDGGVGTTKTKGSQRAVPLETSLATDLRELKLAQPLAARRLNLVFPTSAGGHNNVANLRNRGLTPACKAAGVEVIRWHDLRHYFASILLFELQESDAVVTSLMGHHSIAFTLSQYGHWMPEARRELDIGEKLSGALSL